MRRAASSAARGLLVKGSLRLHTESLTSSFNAADLTIRLTASPAAVPPLDASLQFGRVFSDHMLQIDWTEARGWSAPAILPVAQLSLHPAAQTLQYGAHCFEGLKAYHCAKGGPPRLFRPALNAGRLRGSAVRLALPPFSPDAFAACLAALVAVEGPRWLPRAPGCALYLRPAICATTPFLGVGPPQHAVLTALASPCGPYFSAPSAEGAPREATPPGVPFYLEESVVRAAPGGVGQHKVGGNYAPTIAPQVAAMAAHGCQQVLYTAPAAGGAVVSEAGAMNCFFLLRARGGEAELVTPPLDGTILPGVTRRSVLELARAWGACAVSERPLPVAELAAAGEEGRLLEMFATGTAAVILPISALVRAAGGRIAANSAAEGPLAGLPQRLAQALGDIQHGRTEHEGWSVPVDRLAPPAAAPFLQWWGPRAQKGS